MTSQLDKILVTSETPQWRRKLSDVHDCAKAATYFEDGSDEDKRVSEIINDVRKQGQAAVVEYTAKFDSVTLSAEQLKITRDELVSAHKNINTELLVSIRKSIDNVRAYQKEILEGTSKSCIGNTGIKYAPIKRAGLCIPGASAPLPSTVIMTAVPAQVAGVKEIVVVSPPRYKDSIHPVILAVCHELGITEVYRIGGVQAVTALAYGTETIKPVQKIVGPGNKWVQMAKRKVFGYVDIDSVAGPSEVLILADDSANPEWVAADMLSQAEHDPGSGVVFTDSKKLAEKILAELKTQVALLDRSQQTAKCLEQFSAIVVFDKFEQAIAHANEYAAEHLQIQCGDKSKTIAGKIENAGAIFIGPYSPVATGDYFAGPSHTLPTGQTAKFFSPLSANDFLKSTSIIEYDKETLDKAAPDIIRLAQTEGLDAHAKSVQIRTEN